MLIAHPPISSMRARGCQEQKVMSPSLAVLLVVQVSGYILRDDEVRLKTLLWTHLNKEYLEQQEQKAAAAKAAEDARAAASAAVAATAAATAAARDAVAASHLGAKPSHSRAFGASTRAGRAQLGKHATGSQAAGTPEGASAGAAAPTPEASTPQAPTPEGPLGSSLGQGTRKVRLEPLLLVGRPLHCPRAASNSISIL